METYTLAPDGSGNNYIVPANAPFYLDTLTVSIVATAKTTSSIPLGVSTPLVLGIDYFPGFQFIQATAEQEQPVYGAICLVDAGLRGALSISYGALGNGYSVTNAQILQITTAAADPLSTTWEQAIPGILDYPSTTINYQQSQPVGLTAVVNAINAMVASLGGLVSRPSVFNFNNHINDTTGNPHGLTALQLGVGNVPNWSVASAADVIAGTNARLFVTPAAVAGSVSSVVPQASGLVFGKAMLNLGTLPGDNIDNTKALTAGGLVSMINAGSLVTFSNLQNNQRQAGQVTPFPIVYPAQYNSTTCWNFLDIVNAVQSLTNISPLTYNPATGIIWFPHNVTLPNLVLTYPSRLTTLSDVGQSL